MPLPAGQYDNTSLMQLLVSLAEVQLGDMPNAETLKSMNLKQFDSRATPGEVASKTASTILGQLGGNTPQTQEPQKAGAKLIPTGPGLPTLPKKLVEKIAAGQYVDFSELPPAKGRTRPLPSQEDGHVVVIRAEDLAGSKKLIPDLATWLQCFAIYMVVLADTEPERVKSLLAYMTTIAKASIKYTWPSWIVYDQNFRQEAAAMTLRTGPSIYTQCFTNAAARRESWCQLCQSLDHGSDACPIRSHSTLSNQLGPRERPGTDIFTQPAKKRPLPHSNPQTCRRFNAFNGDCKFGETCIYQHKCMACDQPGHPRSRCPEVKKQPGQPQ